MSVAAALLLAAMAAPAQSPDWPVLPKEAIVLLRHATAPGVGDPDGFRLDDCATQRNLSEAGRAEARAIGESFRRRAIAIGQVLASRWCRAAETAELAFPGKVRVEPAFDSIFTEDPGNAQAQTGRARAILEAWRGPGLLIVVTHQVNITALTGVTTRSGEGVALRNEAGGLIQIGRIAP